MTKTEIKDQVLAMIRDKDQVSFAELTQAFPETFKGGNFTLEAGKTNIVLWSGLTEEGFDIIVELRDENLIDFDPCDPLTYMIDGRALDLPLAKKATTYKHPHWCPIVLRPMAVAHATA